MNILHVMHIYNLIKANPSIKSEMLPRTYMFAGKAAPITISLKKQFA